MKLYNYVIIAAICVLSINTMSAVEKKWELDIHYSSWNVNFLSSTLTGIIEDEIDEYDPENGTITFNSYGHNIGIGIRYYPSGKYGSISYGFSHERNTFKIDLTGNYLKSDSNGQQIEVDGMGKFELYPHSFHFNIRWEILPYFQIHPYFGLGFGVGVLDGNTEIYATSITSLSNGETIEGIEYDENDSLNDLINQYEDDGNSMPIKFFPFLQLQFGIRGEIVKDIFLLAEVQFYNGLSFRGGMAYKF